MLELPTLVGEQVSLRPLSLDDVSDTYIAWLNDPEVTKYNSHGNEVYTRDKAVQYVTAVMESDQYAVFAIYAKDSGKHIGNISLQQISRKNQNAEYAILLGDKEYWGRGVAKEASRLILAYGFKELGLHRIYCGTSALNEPMQKLATSLGFSQEGVRKEAMYKNGAFVDIVEYGLLREQFTA